MDLEAVFMSIASDSIRFVEPTLWQDKYESRFYNASFVNVDNAVGNTPPVLACCFSYAQVNEAAWKLYSYTKTGLGAHCVQMRINKKAIREQIIQNNTGYRLFEGEVNYCLDNYQIDNLHNCQYPNGKENEHFMEIFKDFDLASYLSLLLIKRQAFRHEQELRYLLISDEPSLRGDTESELLHINWKEVLSGIKIDENCSETEVDLLHQLLKSKDIYIEPKKEFLYAAPDSYITIDKPL